MLPTSPNNLRTPWLTDTSALFLVSFAFFLVTLHAALPWGDAPELITASVTLGVPHPPGYPLYVLLGHAMSLLPFGGAAVRLHLLSALCASACLVLLKCSLDIWGRPVGLSARAARLSGLLVLATTPVFWSVARAAEVYSILALLMAVCLYFIVRFWSHRRVPDYCVWFVAGLAMLHHYAIVPVLFWLLLRCRKRSFPILVLPLILLIVPVIRSRAGVVPDWYDPESLKGLIQLTMGGEFAGNVAKGWTRFCASPFGVLFEDGWDLFRQWGLKWGLLLPFILVGVWRLACRSRPYAIEYGAVLLLYTGFYILYLVGDREYFSLPFLVLSAPALCWGLEWLADDLSHRMHSNGPILLGLLLLLFPVWRGHQLVFAERDDEEALRYSADVLRVLPPNALLLVGLHELSQDYEYFPLLYQQAVERRRPDVDIIGTGFLSLPWYDKKLAERGVHPRLRDLPLGKYKTDIEWYEDVWTGIVLEMRNDRPICSTVSPAYLARRRGAASWKKCDSGLLLQGRSFLESDSLPYLPWGTVFLLKVKDNG
ncbi:MAG: DUF2723 domain-containing protein [bacterium]